MSALGRLTNAFFSASNENTLALANVNFDFSVLKFDAPREFQVFGASLTKQRRDEAEDGSIHKTARRLGALFQALVPPTPNLIRVYGARASEIATCPNINPKGSSKHGPFEAYVGADGTSLWAAATSSSSDTKAHAPLAIHLLACMLARAFKPEEAISVWVELVRVRRRAIESALDSEPQSLSACMAARQDISREQLALWDASARSWLQSADEAKRVQRTQLQLVVDNLHLSFTHRESTYEAVTEVWRHAMMGMEKCIKGSPQEVSDGSILLALSSWHLYPDLIIAHEATTKIPFSDLFLMESGAMTIGLQFAPGSRPVGVHWSLTLSHLRYYGDAIEVQSSNEIQRLTIHQLLVMVFGDLLSSWQIPKGVKAQSHCAQWLVELTGALDAISDHRGDFTMTAKRDNYAWLRILAVAARNYLDLQEEDPQTCAMITAWGRRRCKTFMGSAANTPYFGLGSPLLCSALQRSDALEAGVQFLRKMAADMGLGQGEAVIRYYKPMSHTQRTELITAIPHTNSSPKRELDGTCQPQEQHCRWLSWSVGSTDCRMPVICTCKDCDYQCPCAVSGICTEACHSDPSTHSCMTIGHWPKSRSNQIATALREYCYVLPPYQLQEKKFSKGSAQTQEHELSLPDFDKANGFLWGLPPALFHNYEMPMDSPPPCPSLSKAADKCLCFGTCTKPTEYYHQAAFGLVYGSMTGLGLFTRTRLDAQKQHNWHCRLANDVFNRKADPDNIINVLKQAQIQTRPLILSFFDYISFVDWMPAELQFQLTEDFATMASIFGVSALPQTYIKSLYFLSIAHELYVDLEGATIPTEILKTPLHTSNWLSHHWTPTYNIQAWVAANEDLTTDSGGVKLRFPAQFLTQAEMFACIALFESGYHNLDPSEVEPVVALASANSIFVADDLLIDPGLHLHHNAGVQRVVGNIGRAGISMLVLPDQLPRMRPLSDDWRMATHAPYDYHREDNLRGTTLVLSFTEWKRPLAVIQRRKIDEDLNFVECVVSVHDRGSWVADLNPMDLKPCACTYQCRCESGGPNEDDITSIDSWEELLDAPDNIAVVRAQGNWVARLAAAAIRRQQGHEDITCIMRPDAGFCVRCLSAEFTANHPKQGRLGGVIID